MPTGAAKKSRALFLLGVAGSYGTCPRSRCRSRPFFPFFQVDSLLGKVKDHVDDLGLTEEGFRRLYTVMPEFRVNDHHKKLETYLKITDNTKAARITVGICGIRPLSKGNGLSRSSSLRLFSSAFDASSLFVF